ncbi:hypothetical protein QTP88_024436 [Uroleucon formosanum]
MSSFEESLIENVREHKSLYDVFSADYKDQNIRKEAWEEIGTNLQMSALSHTSYHGVTWLSPFPVSTSTPIHASQSAACSRLSRPLAPAAERPQQNEHRRQSRAGGSRRLISKLVLADLDPFLLHTIFVYPSPPSSSHPLALPAT